MWNGYDALCYEDDSWIVFRQGKMHVCEDGQFLATVKVGFMQRVLVSP